MSPSRIARDGRTKVLCFFMGLYVAAASLRGILDGEFVQLRDDAYSSSPLTRHLCALAAGFFAWDIVVCIIDRENWMYQGHAWTCFLTFFWCLVRAHAGRCNVAPNLAASESGAACQPPLMRKHGTTRVSPQSASLAAPRVGWRSLVGWIVCAAPV